MVLSVLVDRSVEVIWHRDAALVDAELPCFGRCQGNYACDRSPTPSDDDFLTCRDSSEKPGQVVLGLVDGDVLHAAIVGGRRQPSQYPCESGTSAWLTRRDGLWKTLQMRDYWCPDDSMAATRSRVRMLREVAISIGSSSSCTDLAAI